VWLGKIWASDALGAQLVSLDPTTSLVRAVQLSNPGAFPYTITISPDDALWFTELFGSKLGRIDSQCKVTEYPIRTGFGGTPTQIQFQNSTYGFYADAGNAASALGEVLSFNPEHFVPQPVDGSFRPIAASSLTLTSNGLWVAQHASSSLAYYNFQTQTWSLFPTTPVGYIDTTLPYFVAANGSLVWFNEHYANRIGVIDTARGLLTEYSLSNPPANKTSQIDNALTFALGGSRVWFTELTANYVGYIDATYKPPFSVYITQPRVALTAGDNVSTTLVVSGASTSPLKIRIADTENFTSIPFRINVITNETLIRLSNGEAMIDTTIRTDPRLEPGCYTLLLTVTNGSINQGAYVWLQAAA